MSRGTFCGRLKLVFDQRLVGSTSTGLSGFERAFSRCRATFAPIPIAFLALARHAFVGPLVPLLFPRFGSLVHENPCDVFFMETQEMEQPAGQASAVVPAAAGVGLVWAEQAVAGQPYRSAPLGLLRPGRLAAWPLRRICLPPDQ